MPDTVLRGKAVFIHGVKGVLDFRPFYVREIDSGDDLPARFP